jgi:hypothetical protein
MSRAELEEGFRSGNGEKIRDALISAFYSEKGEWVQGWCLKFSDHPDPIARYGVWGTMQSCTVPKSTL